MKTVKNITKEIYLDLVNYEEVVNQLRKFKKMYYIDIKISFGSPLEIEYDEEKYSIDNSFGDISFFDMGSKNLILFIIDTPQSIQVRDYSDKIVLELKKL